MDESSSLLFFSSILHHPFLYYLLYTTTVWEFSFQVFISLLLFFSFFFFFFFLFSLFFASRPWPIREKNLIYSEDTFSFLRNFMFAKSRIRLTSEHYDVKMFVFFFFGSRKKLLSFCHAVVFILLQCLYFFTQKNFFVIVLTQGKALEQRALPKLGQSSAIVSLRPVFR
jgi:hypothetical protein